jgi:hypothetical protein
MGSSSNLLPLFSHSGLTTAPIQTELQGRGTPCVDASLLSHFLSRGEVVITKLTHLPSKWRAENSPRRQKHYNLPQQTQRARFVTAGVHDKLDRKAKRR